MIVANDEHPMIPHEIAAGTAHASLAARVRVAIDQRAAAMRHCAPEDERWRSAAASFDHAMRKVSGGGIALDRSIGDGLEL